MLKLRHRGIAENNSRVCRHGNTNTVNQLIFDGIVLVLGVMYDGRRVRCVIQVTSVMIHGGHHRPSVAVRAIHNHRQRLDVVRLCAV